MLLTPGSQILLRLRGTDSPWLSTDYNGVPPRASFTPDSGWTVHAVPSGGVRLECLSVAKRNTKRYLRGDPAAGTVTVDGKKADGTVWITERGQQGLVWLRCVSDAEGPTYLTLDDGGLSSLTDRPAGRSAWHEFAVLPAEQAEAYRAAEADGDYSHMIPFGMSKVGKVVRLKKEKPAHPPLTPGTPRELSGDSPVAVELIAALQPSFNDGDIGEENTDYPKGDDRARFWPHNIVSLDTVATKTGIVHRQGEMVTHTPPPGELAACRKLAAGVVKALAGAEAFGGDSPTPFRPFYLVIGQGEKPPKELSGEVIRAAFRGTIYPDTPIDLEAFDDERFNEEAGWPAFTAWATKQKELRHLRYVSVGYDTAQEPNLPAVFPRLVLGLTKAGSLVGACATIVQA